MKNAGSAIYNILPPFFKFNNEYTGITGSATNADDIARMMRVGSGTSSGAHVTPESAMQVSTVYGCVRILADCIAMLPLRLYKRDGARATISDGHNADFMMRSRPNSIQTPFEFKRTIVGHLALRGNCYIRKFNIGGLFPQLIPLHPDAVTPVVDHSTFQIEYEIRTANGQRARMSSDDIIHIRGLSSDGLVGISPIAAAREGIGLSMQQEQHGARLFKQGANPSGVFIKEGELSDDAYRRLKADLDEKYTGAHNAGKPFLLEDGLSFEKIGMTADEAQFLESRKFQRSEIAMFFGVPPHMLGDVDKATSWGSGIEQQGIGFVTYTLLPWLTNIQQGLARGILTRNELKKHEFKFSTDELTKADFLTRQQGLQIQKTNGIINANEWRDREGMNPRDDEAGDVYDGAGGVEIEETEDTIEDENVFDLSKMRLSDAA